MQPNEIENKLAEVEARFEAPMAFYNSQRDPQDIDLLREVRQMMTEAGLGDRLPEAFDKNRFIIEAQNRASHAQQYNLNRYLTLQFMACPQAGTTQRYSLIYEIAPNEWLRIFRDSILPAMVDYDLPVVI